MKPALAACSIRLPNGLKYVSCWHQLINFHWVGQFGNQWDIRTLSIPWFAFCLCSLPFMLTVGYWSTTKSTLFLSEVNDYVVIWKIFPAKSQHVSGAELMPCGTAMALIIQAASAGNLSAGGTFFSMTSSNLDFAVFTKVPSMEDFDHSTGPIS